MKITPRRITLALALLAIAAATLAVATRGAPEHDAARERQLQRALDRLVAAGVPGAVLLVREDGRTIRLAGGYGNLKPKTEMRTTDRFRVGSITKTFVATVVLQLVAERKLSLDDDVEQHLPGLVPNGGRITVRQLLGHRSGLFDYGGDEEFLAAAYRDPLRNWDPREIVSIATSHEPYFAPGAGWAYANTNYYVLGLIVEAVTGRSLATELRSRIIEPLKLRSTAFDNAPRIAGAHAHGYFLKPFEDVTVGSPSYVWASGALVSNADDLAAFFRALLGGRLVRADLLRGMQTMVFRTPEFSYGLGLQKLTTPCGAVWGHTGGMPGYGGNALSSKDGRRQVVVLVNASDALSSSTNQFRSFNLPARAQPAYERLVETAYCPSVAPNRRARLQRALDRAVAAGVPGVVAVVRDGGSTTRLASGSSILKPRTTMRAGDRFRIASVTKTFVATVVLQLVAEGKVGLDDTVERWVPGLIPNGREITVRHLLNMTSGLFDYLVDGDRTVLTPYLEGDFTYVWKPRELVGVAVAHEPNFAPGERWHYCNTCYVTLGLIVEAATGRSIGAELQRRIFTPLHLRGTSFDAGSQIAGRYAHGYELDGGQTVDVSAVSGSFGWAAGAIVSTADDLATFYGALLGGRLLRPAELRAMQTTVPSERGGYGLGLLALRTPCGAPWGHGGDTAGYYAMAFSSEDARRQVVVLANAGAASAEAVERLFTTLYCD